jgi:basic membrane protein A
MTRVMLQSAELCYCVFNINGRRLAYRLLKMYLAKENSLCSERMSIMKKLLSVLLAAMLCAALLAACGGGNSPSASASAPAGGAPSTAPSATEDGSAAQYGDVKICFLSNPIGNEQFIKQGYDEVVKMADEYGYQWSNMECADTAAWEENARAAAAEGYDLVLAVGWQAAEPFSMLADEYPDTKFAVIDTVASNEKVKSIAFNTVEGSYVMGVMIGAAFPGEKLFGYVCNFQDQASFEYRYGFEQGVKSVISNAEVMYNYANSYSDTAIVHDLAIQQAAAGCTFIFGGVANAANAGIYQAALELADKGTPIYTTGLSVDQTTSDNPYIITGLLKDTAVCSRIVVEELLAGGFTGGAQVLGIKEGAFGVVGVTKEDFNYRNTEIMTDGVIAAGKAALDQIRSGALEVAAPLEGEAA